MDRTIKIPSKIESLRAVEKLIDELYSEIKFSNEIYGNILIATLEAVNNAIVHGNQSNESIDVDINVMWNTNELIFTIKDKGTGFNYENVPDPTAPENLEKINGRGIFLMDKLSDNLKFEDNGSKVELIFKLK